MNNPIIPDPSKVKHYLSLLWSSMESAPKDGTEILLALHYGIRIASWQKWPDISYPFGWLDQDGSCVVRGWKDDPEPTHWMPLPESPERGQVDE